MLIRLSDFYNNRRDNLSGPLKGYVVFNQDPRQLGRVKCNIPGIFDEEDHEDGVAINPERLPWIYPWEGGFSSYETKVNIPPIGAMVMVEFKTGDIYNGFYTGTVPSSEILRGQVGEDYPFTSGSTDEMGNSFKKNKRTREVEYKHSSGSTVKFFKNGDVEINSRGKVIHKTQDNNVNQTLSYADKSYDLSAALASFELKKQFDLTTKLFVTNAGEIQENVSGSKTSEILGGKKTVIGGSRSESVAGNSANVVGGLTDDLFTLLVNRTYGLGYTEKIVAGGYSQDILAGGVNVSVALGAINHTIAAGNYNISIVAGNIVISTKAGSTTVGNLIGELSVDATGNVTVGNKIAKATFQLSGNVEVGNAAGKIIIDPTGSIIVSAVAQCTIKGAQVLLGNSPAGQVLTNITSPVVDTITGAPSIGVPTVLA